jgi:hypothetical protein
VKTLPLPATDNPLGIVAHLLAKKTFWPELHVAQNTTDFAEALIWYSHVLCMHAQQRDLHDALHEAVPGWQDMRVAVTLVACANDYRAYFVSATQLTEFRWSSS